MYLKASLWLMISVALWFSLGTALAEPKIAFSSTEIDLGSVKHAEVAHGAFTIYNRGDSDLDITRFESTCGCTVIESKLGIIAPGKSQVIRFAVDSTGKAGNIRKTIQVDSNDPESPEVGIYLFLNVALQEHQQMDKTALFKGSCGACHSEPAQQHVDETLFEKVCYMCHGHYGLGGISAPINDFDYLERMDAESVRATIANGKVGSAMPAFSVRHGGPLSDEQIDSLVALMEWWKEGYVFRQNKAAQ